MGPSLKDYDLFPLGNIERLLTLQLFLPKEIPVDAGITYDDLYNRSPGTRYHYISCHRLHVQYCYHHRMIQEAPAPPA